MAMKNGLFKAVFLRLNFGSAAVRGLDRKI
jgi:hypothetical protein